jgi:hypothetical protein
VLIGVAFEIPVWDSVFIGEILFSEFTYTVLTDAGITSFIPDIVNQIARVGLLDNVDSIDPINKQ